jgi:flagellin
MASEMTNLTQEQILEQAGTAMLSQAQSQPQLILKLLGG